MDVGFGDESDSEVATTEFGDRSVGIVRRGYKVLSRRAWDAIVSASDSSSDDPAQTKSMMSPHDWLSFLLMTIGKFFITLVFTFPILPISDFYFQCYVQN